MTSSRMWNVVLLFFALILLMMAVMALMPRAAAAAGSRAEIEAAGVEEFRENCVACHGAGGKGDGAFASRLVKPPKDLTAVSASNGGTFPFWRVFGIISGETPVAGHETHQMPDFYASMKSQDFKPGYLPAYVRILLLTHYIESIQAKP